MLLLWLRLRLRLLRCAVPGCLGCRRLRLGGLRVLNRLDLLRRCRHKGRSIRIGAHAHVTKRLGVIETGLWLHRRVWLSVKGGMGISVWLKRGSVDCAFWYLRKRSG